METQPPSASQSRDEVFDIAKGVGMVAVVGLHLSSRSASLFHKPGDDSWWILKWVNLFLNFCVPLFLLVSAVLLARSASRQDRPDWKAFAWKRARSILIPLLVWSLAYWLMRAVVQHDPKVLKPGYWSDAKGRLLDLAFGKAEFHLYFMSVLAQLCLVLPFFVVLFRRVRMNVWVALLVGAALQAGAFALEKVVLFTWPGSTVFWYLATVVPGIWLGVHWADWPKVRRRTWILWAVLAAAGFAAFGFENREELVRTLLKLPGITRLDGTIENAGGSAYGLGMPMLILGLLSLWHGGPSLLRTALRRIGEMSLQVYLMHPILLQFLSKPILVRSFKVLPLPSVWLFAATLAGTYGVALLLERVPYANLVLFGRGASRQPKPV